MAWDLDGSTQYFDCIMPAAIKAAAGGPFTMIAFCELDDAANGTFMCNMSGSTVFQVAEVFTTYNYGTSAGTRNGPNPTSQSPSAVGTPYIVVISKDTGNVAPEYTLIPWVSGAPGTPVSGTITGGGATLGNGSAPGASGFIRCAQYGTVTGERLNGKIIAMAQYTVYKNSTARALLDSWTDWLDTAGAGAGLGWAMEFTALTTRTDASGNGGDESARNGTSPYTLTSDPANFFPSGGSAVSVADAPNGVRLRSGYETVSSGLAVADSPAGARWRSPEGSGAFTGVQAALDAPNGLRLRSGYETVTSGVSSADVPGRISWRSSYETLPASGSAVSVADGVPDGHRLRSVGGAAVLGVLTTDLPIGWRLRATPDGVSSGVSVADRPLGWRLRSAPEMVGSGLAVADLPAGLRLRSAPEQLSLAVSVSTDRPDGWRWSSGATAVSGGVVVIPDITIVAGVDTVRVTAPVNIIRITAPVRRFRA